jgi:uroporphyrinogen decarboxylase
MELTYLTPKERVQAALEQRPPDRPPVFEYFWPQWEDRWHVEKGFATWKDIEERGYAAHDFDKLSLEDWQFDWERDIYDYYDIDLRLISANYAARINGEEFIEETSDCLIIRDSWGVIRKRLKSSTSTNAPDSFFEGPIRTLADLDKYEFDPPNDPCRFEAWAREAEKYPDVPFFINLWGPFAAYFALFGLEGTLYDVIDRPDFVRTVSEWLVDFMIEVGISQAKVAETIGNPVLGVWVFEDVAYNRGLLISPDCYEDIFRPVLSRLCKTLHSHGVEFSIFHSDGDFRPLIPILVEIGIDAIQPLEVRAGMDVVELRAHYGNNLCYIGNIDNTGTLSKGSFSDIYQEVMRKLPVGKNGGYVVGSSHSIGPDVSIENYEYFRELVREFPDEKNG